MKEVKGIKAYTSTAVMVLLMQMCKLAKIVNSMELIAIIAVAMTVGLTIKLMIFDKKLREAKYWPLLIWILIQEIAIGLDQVLPMMEYNIVVSCGLLISMLILYGFDAPSIRKHMDDDAYVLKSTTWLLTITYAAAVTDILVGYMFPTRPI